MNYASINKYDTANGPGIRVSIFVSGCTLKCKGCFNPESWNFCFGSVFTEESLNSVLKYLEPEYINGLSILGGDPLEPENQEEVLKICKKVKEVLPNKTIWLWTGRVYNKIKDLPIMKYIDTIVDGPYVESMHKMDLLYRGSSNQNIIHLTGNKNGK